MKSTACSKTACFFCIITCLTLPSFSQSANQTMEAAVAIQGYDPVAYFESGQAVSGSSDYQVLFNGKIWRFASTAHLNLFNSNPEKFIPQFNGKCAWSAMKNFIAKGNPTIWIVQDDHLYFFFSRGVKRQFEKEREQNIQIAQQNWNSLCIESE